MALLTRSALDTRFVCLLLGVLATRGAFSAETGVVSRYVMAPGDPTTAPADPTQAPPDPTFAPADPRDIAIPRDMTNPRAFRRALRGRTRERVAPDAPVTNVRPLRDFTNPPIAADRPAHSPRSATPALAAPLDNQSQPARIQAARMAPAEPVRTAEVVRTVPAAPTQITEPEIAQTAVSEPATPLTPAEPVPLPPPPADPIADAPRSVEPARPLAVDGQRVSALNKPIHQIALVEPIDEEGLRPADAAGELGPDGKPVELTGSMFWIAHPARYLYCFSHNPLYFEDANLERCGIGHGCCQPACSAAKFVGQAALLPYSLIVNPPCNCESTLGDCPTCHAYPWGVDHHH